MAASIGELFIQLGVDADIKPLDDAIKKMREVVKGINEEVKANKRLLKYLNDINNARTEAQKKIIKENFVKELQIEKQEKEIKALEKAKEGKLKQIAAIKGAIKGFAGFVAAISGAVYALNKLTNSLVQNNQEFLNLTRNSDIALSTFQKWDAVGRMFGVRGAANQIANLNQRLYELKLTGQGAEGFMFAGINPMGQSAEGVMEQLRNRVSGLNDTAATFLLNKMGLDPSMLHLLRMTRVEFEAFNNEINKYQLTKDQRKEIQQLNAQLEIAKIKLQYLKDRIILKILPPLVQFMHSIARISIALKDIVKSIERITVLKNVLIAIGAGLLIWFHPLIALFGALYLIIDDIVGYMQGKKSLFGVVLAAINEFKENGFLGDEVPEWIRLLAEAADKLTKWWNEQKQEAAKREEAIAEATAGNLRTELNSPYIQAVKNADGSYGFAEVIPDAYKRPSLNGINQSLDNSRNFNKTKNTTVNMNNTFNTPQPAQDVYRDLLYLNNAFAPNF